MFLEVQKPSRVNDDMRVKVEKISERISDDL